jgi:hypothetical protein
MKKKNNFFENGRRPQYFENGRRHQICSRQPKRLIFGMPPYFDPTRRNIEDDLNILENGRRPQFFLNGR